MRTTAQYHDATDLAAALAQRCEQATLKGDTWQACCPAHDDQTPSLAITPAGTKVLIHCHAGCTNAAIVTALGFTLADLFVSSPPRNGHKRIRTIYPYHDAHGHVVHETVRYETEVKNERFSQRRPDPARPGAYLWNLQGIEPVLYNLPAVVAALAQGTCIHLTEGEKDAETLKALGLVATTVPMGATFWRDSHTATLTGAHVVLWPDNDDAGQACVTKVQRHLTGKAQTLRMVRVPSPYKDVSDWVKGGGTRAEVEAFIAGATPPPTLPPTPDPAQEELPVEETRPVIRLGPDITRMVDAGQEALLALPHGPVIFQRARRLSMIARGVTAPKYLHRPADAPIIVEAHAAYLDELATQAARWEKFDKRAKKGEEWVEVTPPSRFTQTLLARPSWPFPLLEGIIHAPTLRPDGSLLDAPGYDADTGLFFDSNGTRFPALLSAPTIDDARSALSLLQEVVKDFPFAKPCHFAAWLSAVLSVVCRFTVQGCVPLHGITDTTRGSGKTLLADTIAVISTGRPAARWSQVFDEDEERKRMLALALDGDPLICIDNVTAPLGSGVLAGALTGSSFKDRLLGVNQTKEAPLSALFLCTGNNVQYVGDVARRVVPIAIDPVMERPEERTDFTHPNLLAWVKQHRPWLTIAALTIVKAYFEAGCPAQGLTPFGSFEAWSALIRQAIVWLGEADPCEGRKDIEATSNPEFETLTGLLYAWHACYGQTPVTLAQVEEETTRKMQHVGPDTTANEWNDLHAALGACDARYDGKQWSTRTIGNALRAWQGRVIDGKRFVTPGRARANKVLWKVEVLS